MFNNPGKKLKIVATIVFVVMIITCVVLAFVLGFKKGSNGRTDFDEAFFFSFFFGGPVAAYLISLGIYAFGTLVLNSDRIVTILSRITVQNNDNHPAEKTQKKKEDPVEEKPTKDEFTYIKQDHIVREVAKPQIKIGTLVKIKAKIWDNIPTGSKGRIVKILNDTMFMVDFEVDGESFTKTININLFEIIE